jgi:hypothetical protein
VTLLFAVLHLAVVLLIFLVATAWGYRVLEMLKCEAQNNLEAMLFASGLSFATLAIVLFFLAFAGWLRFGSAVVVLALMAISAGRGWRHLCSASRDLLASLRPSSLPMSEPIVLLLIAAFLAIGGYWRWPLSAGPTRCITISPLRCSNKVGRSRQSIGWCTASSLGKLTS